MLMSKGIEPLCENIMYFQGIKTDHSALIAVIKEVNHERGPGYWKANTSLLLKDENKRYIVQEIAKDIQTVKGNPNEKWEAVKAKLIVYLKNAARRNAETNQLIIAQLSEQLAIYEQNFPLNRDDLRLYQESKLDLETLLEEKAKGTIFRCKVRWYEYGEKTSKYFYNLEKNQIQC